MVPSEVGAGLQVRLETLKESTNSCHDWATWLCQRM